MRVGRNWRFESVERLSLYSFFSQLKKDDVTVEKKEMTQEKSQKKTSEESLSEFVEAKPKNRKSKEKKEGETCFLSFHHSSLSQSLQIVGMPV